MKSKLDEFIKNKYNEYLTLPLATIGNNDTEIYKNKWCVITGLAFCSPDPHRYYTIMEFAFYLGQDKNLFDRFK